MAAKYLSIKSQERESDIKVKKLQENETESVTGTYIVHSDFLPVKHFGHTNQSSFRVNYKHVEGILACTNALQRVVNIFVSFIIWSNLKTQNRRLDHFTAVEKNFCSIQTI